MRWLLLVGATALGSVACTTPDAATKRSDTTTESVSNEVLVEVVASQVVERDGLTCLQGLDAYGNVVEERCEVAAEDAR